MRGGRRRVVERECGSREVCPWGRQTQRGWRSALQVDSGQGQGTFDHGVKEADCWNSLLDL